MHVYISFMLKNYTEIMYTHTIREKKNVYTEMNNVQRYVYAQSWETRI